MTFRQSQEFLLEMVKKHLKVDFDDDDNYLRLLIMAATEYIDDAVNLAEQNNPANANRLLLLLLVIIADMYEHRSMSFEPAGKVQYTVRSIISQLQAGDDDG